MAPHQTSSQALEGGLFADRGDGVIACSIIFIVLCTLCLCFRFISHRIDRRSFNVEDWLMIPAWILQMSLCANVICSVELGGVGRHEEYILKYKPTAMKSWAQTLFVTELIYGILIPLEKTAILLLYLRLFRINNWFRTTTYILLATIWFWGLCEFLVAIFQCKPIPYQWNKKINGSCIDQLSFYRYIRVPNAVHDVAMLAAPAPVIAGLQIAFRQKVALMGIFLLGSVGCIASFVSMALFFRLDAFSDTTWASIHLMSWTLAEPGVIFICACLPALWPLIIRVMPCISPLRNTSAHKSNRYGPIGPKENSGASNAGNTSTHTEDSVPLTNLGIRAAESGETFRSQKSPDTGTPKDTTATKGFSWDEDGSLRR